MAVDAVTKKEFQSKISGEKQEVTDADKDIAMYKKMAKENDRLKPFFHLGIMSKYLHQINTYMDMSDLSERMMNIKNNSYLDSARKLIYKVYAEAEHLVTMQVDEPLDFNKEMLMAIKPFNPKKRLNLYKHVQRATDRLIKSYGENTKWKWSFPDMWAKLAIMGKNIIHYREIQAIRDPREEFFYDRTELLEAVKIGLFDAAGKFRERFELSTKSTNDLLYAIRLLEDLRRICSMMGDQEQGDKCRSAIDAYRARIEAEEEAKEAAKGGGAKKKKKKKTKKKKKRK